MISINKKNILRNKKVFSNFNSALTINNLFQAVVKNMFLKTNLKNLLYLKYNNFCYLLPVCICQTGKESLSLYNIYICMYIEMGIVFLNRQNFLKTNEIFRKRWCRSVKTNNGRFCWGNNFTERLFIETTIEG